MKKAKEFATTRKATVDEKRNKGDASGQKGGQGASTGRAPSRRCISARGCGASGRQGGGVGTSSRALGGRVKMCAKRKKDNTVEAEDQMQREEKRNRYKHDAPSRARRTTPLPPSPSDNHSEEEKMEARYSP